MDTEKLLGHSENLAPGFVTLAILASRFPADVPVAINPTMLAILQQPFVLGAITVSFAYILGVLVFVLARLPVDTLSALTLRPVLLKAYRWRDFPRFHPIRINQRYRAALDTALRKPPDDAIRQEVAKRRVRGRLIRTCVVPLTLWLWPVSSGATVIGAFVLLIGIYSYSEVTIYQEARLAM